MANIGMMEGAYFVGRIELLGWINTILTENYTKIEQMSSGVAYCQLIDAIYPGKVALHKVCFSAKLEYEFIKNWKVLQDAFIKLNIDKTIDIPRLTKSKYQDNLEFMQWMKRYFDLNYGGVYDFQERKRQAIAMAKNPTAAATTASISPTSSEKSNTPSAASPPITNQAANQATTPSRKPGSTSRRTSTVTQNKPAAVKPAKENVLPTPTVNDTAIKELQTALTELHTTAELLEKDRDFYFNKLKEVNAVCQTVNKECPAELINFVAKIQKILYSTEEDNLK